MLPALSLLKLYVAQPSTSIISIYILDPLQATKNETGAKALFLNSQWLDMF